MKQLCKGTDCPRTKTCKRYSPQGKLRSVGCLVNKFDLYEDGTAPKIDDKVQKGS